MTIVAGWVATGATVCVTGAVAAAEVAAGVDEAVASFTASEAELGAASRAGVAPVERAGTAVSTEPALDPLTTGPVAGDGRGATCGGNKARGSTYPCGSLVVRAPKYT